MSSQRCVQIDTSRNEVILRNRKASSQDAHDAVRVFTFDAVFDMDSTQQEVYQSTAKDIVDSVLQGYNGTIMAYGQTGSGKTFTMEGSTGSRGIIPNSFDHIFAKIQEESNAQRNFLVGCSMIEIYNDDIYDLLSKDSKQKIQINEHPEKGFYIRGLKKYIASGVKEMYRVLKVGNHKRTVGATNMNEGSSRSHAIFMITIEMSEPIDLNGQAETGTDTLIDSKKKNSVRVGKLNMVDLAGSERQAKTGATGDRQKEGAHINLSLSALINVIQQLSSVSSANASSTFVPYRNSKLTMLLKDSLGGNTKTIMIANVSPAEFNYEETLSTLRYATTAKKIQNKPKINEDPKDTMLRQYQEQIELLKKQLLSFNEQGGSTTSAVPLRNIMDEETLKKMIEKNDFEKQRLVREMQEKSENEKEALALEKQKVEEETRRFEEELRKRQEDLESQRIARQTMEKKLLDMESRVVLGGVSLEDQVKLRESQIQKRQIEIEKRRHREERYKEEIQKRNEEMEEQEELVVSLHEEAEIKTRKLKKLWNKYQQSKKMVEDIQSEFNVEKFEYLDTIRQYEREMSLQQEIIDLFIPEWEVAKIMQRAIFDEQTGEWYLESLLGGQRHENNGNNGSAKVNLNRPASARPGQNRAVCDFVRHAASRTDNPRFRTQNVIQLDLDMPVRTTEDYYFADEEQVDMMTEEERFQRQLMEQEIFTAMNNRPLYANEEYYYDDENGRLVHLPVEDESMMDDAIEEYRMAREYAQQGHVRPASGLRRTLNDE